MRVLKGFSKLRDFQPRDFQLVGAILCSSIFAVGGFFGYANFAPASSINTNNSSSNISGNNINAIKSIISLIGGSGLIAFYLFFVSHYVEGNIEEEKDKLLQEVDSSYRFEQELEFLSRISESSQPSKTLNYESFCNRIKQLKIQPELVLKEVLESYVKDLKGREEALECLINGFKEEKDSDRIPLISIIGTACNHVLKIPKPQEWAEPLYLDIVKYLRAWLFCSIKYGEIVQIKPFIQGSLGKEGEGRYHGKETYIEVIKYIKNVVLKDDGVKPYFTPDSIIIIDKYLKKLIELLESEKIIS